MRRLLCFILVALFLNSCRKPEIEKEILVDSFPIEETLSGSRIDLADAEYLSNMAFFAGDYLVFRAIRDNYFLQIYDQNFNLVGKILNKGEGPEELPDATWNGQWRGESSNPEVTVFSGAKRRLVALDIHPFGGLSTLFDLPVSENLDPTIIYQTSDTTLLGITLNIEKGSALFSYNTKTHNVRKAESPLEFVDGPMVFYTSQQTMDFDTGRKEICCAYLYFPTLVIYGYNFNILRTIHIGEKVNTSTLSYSDKHSSLANVRYYKDFVLVMITDADTNESKLLVFDADGEPRASFGIGQAIWYVVDEAMKRIIAVKYDSEADIVYLESCQMPEILLN